MPRPSSTQSTAKPADRAITAIPSTCNIGRTPLVPLRRLAAGLPVPVLVKCEHMNPGGSVKDRIALAIVNDAEERGVLAPGATLIEATAGNTGVGLALVAATRGYSLVCVMPEKMSIDKRVALATLGAKVIVTPNAAPSHPDNFRNVARRLASEHGWFLMDQFNNPANVRVHAETTGAEILSQAGGHVGAFVAGAGTGGTSSGMRRFLKGYLPKVQVVLADPVGSGLADWVETGRLGPDGAYAVEGIGGSEVPENLHRDVIDRAVRVQRRGELRNRAPADPRGGPARRRVRRHERGRSVADRRSWRGRRSCGHGAARRVGSLPGEAVDVCRGPEYRLTSPSHRSPFHPPARDDRLVVPRPPAASALASTLRATDITQREAAVSSSSPSRGWREPVACAPRLKELPLRQLALERFTPRVLRRRQPVRRRPQACSNRRVTSQGRPLRRVSLPSGGEVTKR